jgi:Ohr subfamily peroxiredoxin
MGGSGTGNNPEQLFAAGYAACFSNAILHVATQQKLNIKEAPVRADIGIGPREDGGFALTAKLDVTLDLDQKQALELVRTAHHVCPYSHAIKGNIDVMVNVNNQSIKV